MEYKLIRVVQVHEFMITFVSFQMPTSNMLFKVCVCENILRSSEFKRHMKKGQGHGAVYQVAGCVTCRQFCEEESKRVEFYERHRKCDTGKSSDKTFQDALREYRKRPVLVSDLSSNTHNH